ncbi:MFS transporter [Candidatus Bodocaedibacter vickermanii]|uniref:Proline/betaine transporter n=1 Tax=Candidatus Bodocaedibacter vickermanii TaxID=2741701 RepID=A0A7L9RT80_9PROT|nr:Proline/betaine transporter [Candidatus Paracaedibacteraceae bacterium 'Lake Konstanz']
MVRIILSCMIGNALEWYAFVIFGFFAPTISQLFFPGSSETVGLIKAFALFGMAFIARPLGAIIFGHIGDKFSRKNALLLSIFVMAIPTVLIGCLPTYESVGVLAPVLLSILLVAQGFAIGGEFTGSMVFMIESAQPHQRGLIGSWATFSCVFGVILGSLVSLMCTTVYSPEEILAGAWRIPFVLTLAGTLVGTYIRKNVAEPKTYLDHKAERKSHAFPLKELFTEHSRSIVSVVLIDFITAIGFFLLVIFLPTYLQSPVYLGLDADYAMKINTFNMVIFALTTLVGGALSDRYGRKTVFMYVAGILLIGGYPIFQLFHVNWEFGPLVAQFILAVHIGLFFGVIPAGLSEIFPSHLRFTGLSVSHNISMALFGGSAPLLATGLIELTHDLAAPGILLMVAAVFCLMGMPLYEDKYKVKTI